MSNLQITLERKNSDGTILTGCLIIDGELLDSGLDPVKIINRELTPYLIQYTELWEIDK